MNRRKLKVTGKNDPYVNIGLPNWQTEMGQCGCNFRMGPIAVRNPRMQMGATYVDDPGIFWVK